MIIASPGGYVREAVTAATVIRNFGLDVEVIGECASSCVMLLAAGDRREVNASGMVGIHRSWTASGQTNLEDHQAHISWLGKFYEQQGVSQQLIFDTMAIPSEDMKWLTTNELRNYGLVR